MFIDRYTIFDVELFMAFILLVIIGIIYIRQAHKTRSSRLFLALCWSTVAILLVESVSWLFDGAPGEGPRAAVYISVFIFYFLEPLPMIAWLCYLDYQIFESAERLKRRWYYLQPFILNTAVMIFSAFTDFIFSVNAANEYQREGGVFYAAGLQIGLVAFSFILFFANKKRAKHKVFRAAVIFSVIPILGMVLQLLTFGPVLIWPLVAVAVFFVYAYLETQKEIRDYLTGLLNRQQFEELLQIRMRDYRKKGPFVLMMLDLNDFKKINDQYGHKEGDRALVAVAERLTGSVKNIDKVARFGGDEFVILAESDKTEEVEKIIGRIRQGLEEENERHRRPYALSLSAGYAVYSPEKYSSLTQLVNQADLNMYSEKFRNTHQG